MATHLTSLGLDAAEVIRHVPTSMTLSLVDGVLFLQDRQQPKTRVTVDFVQGSLAYRASGHVGGEHLIKACQIKSIQRPHILDATCGMGKDSFLLASSGFQVTACEQHPLVHALLTDGLRRLQQAGGEAFELQLMSAEKQMQQPGFDVIYLDPMFPARSKSAKVKKDMQLFQHIHQQQDDNAVDLLNMALQADCQRVVIKRPPKAPLLVNRKPTFQISGKSCRFDAYQLL
ncbi:class I SAM-dependent methyltransferase [Marinicella sediminis]|uniref:Ribosomal RNA small subunit methyltransferase J n=1 Tax=Marinicella sediminis TaxID=1792834 RepID=A0ABV7JEX9_9GAMM